MPLIRDTPALRRLRRAAAASPDGIVTFGDVLGGGRPQGRMAPVKDAATGQLSMVSEDPPVAEPADPVEERRHYLIYVGLNLLGHIEGDKTADLPSSLAAGDSIRDALHRSSPENDRIFARDMRQLIADLRAVDGLKGFRLIDRLEELIAQVLD